MNAGTLESARLRHPAGSRLVAAEGQVRAAPGGGRAGLRLVPRESGAGPVSDDSPPPDGGGSVRTSDRFSTTPLRLTRRGRVALVVVILALVFCGGLTFGSRASGVDARSAPAAAVRSVVVQPGQTLWAIARDIDAKGDPRVMIDRIISLNALRGARIEAGRRLLVP